MKICTITCHHAINHGAMLQAYALASYLKSQGHSVEIIDYLPDYLAPRKIFYQNPKFKKIGLGWLYAIVKFKSNYKLYKRRIVFEKFFKKYLPITKTHYESIHELKDNYPFADVYIAGSDQIWNTTFQNGTDPAFYLFFGNKDTLRISYAASFATDAITADKIDFVKKGLSNIDYISVRESSAVKLSQSLGYNATQVVDPVFLIEKELWDSLLKSDQNNLPSVDVKKGYLLVYDFMDDENIWSIAVRISKLRGWRIFSLFGNPQSDESFYYYGPTTFIHLIKNAQCIISNSFHGTAFSMIYQKDFFVVNRNDGLNTRMQNLLSHYGLEDRLINISATDETLVSHIDYSTVTDVIQSDITESKCWINNTLNSKYEFKSNINKV